MKKSIFFFFIFLSFFVQSQKKIKNFSKEASLEEKDSKALVHSILDNYQKRKSVVMRVKKKFTQKLLSKQNLSEGKFYFSKGLWRFDVTSPRKSSLFYNGQKIVYSSDNNVSHHTALNSQNMILSLLLDRKKFYKIFTYQGLRQKGRTQIYDFSAKPPEPQKISIQIEKDRILSLLVSWEEPLGEEYYRFSSIQFDQKLPKKLFLKP